MSPEHRRRIATRKKMDGNDKEDGTRHGIFGGKNAMDGDEKEDGWQRQRRWMATTDKMEGDMAFFGGRVPWTVTTKKMDGDDGDNG